MAVRIEVPEGEAALREFVRFHDEVYASRPSRWTSFMPLQLPWLLGESPFNDARTLRPFGAYESGRLVARVVAAVDRRYQRHWQETIGHLLMFEAQPGTRDAVRTLFDAACAWLAEQGTSAARVGFGLLESPFRVDDDGLLPPSFLRQNPAYYHSLLKDAGCETERGFVDYAIEVGPELITRWESMVEAARRADVRLLPIRDVPAQRRVAEFTALWNEAFAEHWGVAPSSEEEFGLLLGLQMPLGVLDVSLLAYRGGEPVGVLWVAPEMTGSAALAPGHVLDDCERLNFLGIGVRRVARGQGINLAMAAHAYLELVRRGARWLSYTLVLDDNWPSRRTAEKLGAHVCASYVAYRRRFTR